MIKKNEMIVQIELLMQKSQFNFIMKGQGNSQKIATNYFMLHCFTTRDNAKTNALTVVMK